MPGWIWVGLGSGIGGILRYWVASNITVKSGFPVGVFVVNIVGSFLIGAIFGSMIRYDLGPTYRLLLMTGVCGGFTTFSSFSMDTVQLLQSGNYLNALVYVVMSVVVCCLCTWAGMAIFK